MDPKEKKEFTNLVGEVIDQKVTPRFDKLEKKVDKIGNSVEYIREQVIQNSEDITILQENVKDTLLTEERIETLVEASIRRQDSLSIKTDQLSRRVLHLESKKT